jgi:uncharacterized protein (DUF362 family)
MPLSALVALIRSTPATAMDDFERLMELAQFRRQLDPHATVLLRPDARRHFPFPAANTTPWQLEGALRALRATGCREVAWLPPRTHRANIGAGKDLSGYLPILGSYSVRSWQAYDATKHEGNLLLPTLKTDAATTLGGALWCLVDERADSHGEARGHAHQRLVGALAASRRRRAGIFAVMDGTTVGVGPGPYVLRPEVRGVLLASADPLALDAVAARLVGFDPLRDIAYIRLAYERGLGVADPRAIELVGDTDLARHTWAFAAGSWRRPPASPLPDIFGPILERLRWSLVERPVFESWLRGTLWGRLFGRYQRLGYGEGHGLGGAADM